MTLELIIFKHEQRIGTLENKLKSLISELSEHLNHELDTQIVTEKEQQLALQKFIDDFLKE